jgi:hypothetical protein
VPVHPFHVHHVLNPLVHWLNQTGAAQGLQAKSKHLRQVILKLKAKQPKENDGLGCTYEFKEAGKPIGREGIEHGTWVLIFFFTLTVPSQCFLHSSSRYLPQRAAIEQQ